MGKRSAFERAPRDAYPTPYSCIPALLPHLLPGTRFYEPCAGDGRLIGYLQEHGHVCEGASDIEPQCQGIKRQDALTWIPKRAGYLDRTIITNPPWRRNLLHPLIRRFSGYHPTWLLFDVGWASTAQAAPLLERCRKIVVIGRVKWIEGSKHSSLEDAAWYFFTAEHRHAPALFYGKR